MDNALFGFLSSLYWEHETLRSEVYEMGRRYGLPIWVAERSDTILWQRHPLERVDVLIARVREAEQFLCVLGPMRHGSLIELSAATNVSYFEIELYQAALLRKPTHIFLAKGFGPDPRLTGLLEIARFAFPHAAIVEELSDKEILLEIEQVLRRRIRRKHSIDKPANRAALPRFVSRLSDARSSVPLLFAGGVFDKNAGPPDTQVFAEALASADASLNQEAHLARSWLAIRELQGAPYNESKFSDFLTMWNEALGHWAGAASWYGLHGHLFMGVLASLNSLHIVRERLLREGVSTTLPNGPLASAIYSIAKLQSNGRSKRAAFTQALKHANLALDSPLTDRSGVLAIRGSIYLQLRRTASAVRDYETVLKLREQANDTPARIGEAMSELGFGYLMQRKYKQAIGMLANGVQMLAPKPSGFLVRAKKKLALAYLVTGRLRLAAREAGEARAMAADLAMFDQISAKDWRPLERLMNRETIHSSRKAPQ